MINIKDNDIRRILIENTPLTSSISGSAYFLLINLSRNYIHDQTNHTNSSFLLVPLIWGHVIFNFLYSKAAKSKREGLRNYKLTLHGLAMSAKKGLWPQIMVSKFLAQHLLQVYSPLQDILHRFSKRLPPGLQSASSELYWWGDDRSLYNYVRACI